jgi:hypothetical protein
MSNYSDTPEINSLYEERENLTNGIACIDGGGSMTYFTIEAAPPAEGVVLMMPQVPVRVVMQPPTPQATLDNVRAWMVQRQADIDNQLSSLGVTNTPAALR